MVARVQVGSFKRLNGQIDVINLASVSLTILILLTRLALSITLFHELHICSTTMDCICLSLNKLMLCYVMI